MYTWSLDALYKDFDDTYIADLKTLDENLDVLNQLSLTLDGIESLEAWLELSKAIDTLAMNLGSFASLRMSTHTDDTIAIRYMGQIQNIFSKMARPHALFTKWMATKREVFPTWIELSPLIKEHAFILQETIDQSRFALNEEVEEAISKMKINGSTTWSLLQQNLTSSTTIDYNGKKHTMTSLRNLAYSADATVRKEAYAKELELYRKIDDSIAFALNSIKGEVIQTNALRGYASPLEETLINSRLSQDTLDALIQAIEESLPQLRRYLLHKGKLMGYKNGLPWHEIFAPVALDNPRNYSIDDSKTLIVNAFSTFSKDLEDMTLRAYDEQWIDFLPKEGKVGGAFCSNLPQIKQSRILSNYGGSISDIITLAHELGHAYHGLQLEDNSILNTGYTMPVAETASTFCENIVFNATLDTVSDEEKIMLVENSLQDLIQITIDILSRYKFETMLFAQREEDFLNSEKLQELMILAQSESYGEGLDPTTYNPYMWLCKGHYYSASNNFYNFPYAFGGLFALGLYAQYEIEKEAFVPKYQNLLKATAKSSCEDVAKLAGIDTTDVGFWKQSIDQIIKRIDLYMALTDK